MIGLYEKLCIIIGVTKISVKFLRSKKIIDKKKNDFLLKHTRNIDAPNRPPKPPGTTNPEQSQLSVHVPRPWMGGD